MNTLLGIRLVMAIQTASVADIAEFLFSRCLFVGEGDVNLSGNLCSVFE